MSEYSLRRVEVFFEYIGGKNLYEEQYVPNVNTQQKKCVEQKKVNGTISLPRNYAQKYFEI